MDVLAIFRQGRMTRMGVMGVSLIALVSCAEIGDFDVDLRKNGFGTSDAARAATAPKPQADARGIISYPGYQVAQAQKGDTLTTLAARVGLTATELARYNGLDAAAPLREGEIIALPRRVEAQNQPTSTDVTALAGAALDRIGPNPAPTMAQATPSAPLDQEPARHQVNRGETAYSIARLYNVSVPALADWNSLDSALSVREGQFLLIPTTAAVTPTPVNLDTPPGVGTPTPLPPSSAAPLPDSPSTPASAAPANTPASPNLAETRTAASGAAMSMPVAGKIVGAYVKGKSDGIDISAPAGTPVIAARAGTVAAITRDTDNVPILVLRHADNLLTVYAGIDNISVAKGATVGRGQSIAQVRKTDSPALHFQVRKGTASVDPMSYLN